MTLAERIARDAEVLIKLTLVADQAGKILVADEVELSASDYTQALIGELVRQEFLRIDACLLLPGWRAAGMDVSDILAAWKERGQL
jgi:hypothetical protein